MSDVTRHELVEFAEECFGGLEEVLNQENISELGFLDVREITNRLHGLASIASGIWHQRIDALEEQGLDPLGLRERRKA